MHGAIFLHNHRHRLSMGTSPYARGNLSNTSSSSRRSRYIPVCTGQSVAQCRHQFVKQVHPRMHGAISILHQEERGDQGTSPYARGNHRFGMSSPNHPGYIPVCTGQSVDVLGHHAGIQVHPRMHGAIERKRIELRVRAGTSPYARGNHHFAILRNVKYGYIPVCTGQSTLSEDRMR